RWLAEGDGEGVIVFNFQPGQFVNVFFPAEPLNIFKEVAGEVTVVEGGSVVPRINKVVGEDRGSVGERCVLTDFNGEGDGVIGFNGLCKVVVRCTFGVIIDETGKN